MTERETASLQALKASKKYGGICAETVDRVFAEALSKHRSLKDADKAARSVLHQITGAFMTPVQIKAARKLLAAHAAGDGAALTQTLSLHASTAERLPLLSDLYGRVFDVTGRPDMILDLACGLNPLYLGSMGLSVRGVDIGGDQVALVNDWARQCGWDVSARTADLCVDGPLERGDLALMMKLLPVLETQKKGAARALLARAPARWQLVTFPTRTLGGRGVGMEANYTRWFEDHLPESHRIVDRFTLTNELCYITEAENG